MRSQCKALVWRGHHKSSCSRSATRDGYCKQHHPDSVLERDRKSEEVYQLRRKACPAYQLGVARKVINEATARLATDHPELTYVGKDFTIKDLRELLEKGLK